MHTLKDWKAKRAGAGMTIYAKNEHGDDIKLVGVDQIVAAKPHPIATDKSGRTFALA